MYIQTHIQLLFAFAYMHSQQLIYVYPIHTHKQVVHMYVLIHTINKVKSCYLFLLRRLLLLLLLRIHARAWLCAHPYLLFV